MPLFYGYPQPEEAHPMRPWWRAAIASQVSSKLVSKHKQREKIFTWVCTRCDGTFLELDGGRVEWKAPLSQGPGRWHQVWDAAPPELDAGLAAVDKQFPLMKPDDLIGQVWTTGGGLSQVALVAPDGIGYTLVCGEEPRGGFVGRVVLVSVPSLQLQFGERAIMVSGPGAPWAPPGWTPPGVRLNLEALADACSDTKAGA